MVPGSLFYLPPLHLSQYIETSCSYQNTKTLLHFYDLMVVIVPPNKTAANGPEKACTEQRGCLEKSPQKEGLHPTARDEPDKAGPARARASTCQTAGPEEKHRIMARPLPPPPPVPCSRRRSLHSPLPLRCPLSTPAHLFFWTITGSGELATWES